MRASGIEGICMKVVAVLQLKVLPKRNRSNKSLQLTPYGPSESVRAVRRTLSAWLRAAGQLNSMLCVIRSDLAGRLSEAPISID
jgi:hypothetical protein